MKKLFSLISIYNLVSLNEPNAYFLEGRRQRIIKKNLFKISLLPLVLSASVAYADIDVNNSFSPATVTATEVSTITVKLLNSALTPATSAAFTNVLPDDVFIAATPNMTTTCGGATSQSNTATRGELSLSGGTIPAGDGTNPGSCKVTVDVYPKTKGTFINTIGIDAVTAVTNNVTVKNTQSSNATLLALLSDVTGSIAYSIAYSQASGSSGFIQGGETSKVTITLNNPNSVPLTGMAFTDQLNSYANIIKAVDGTASTTCGGGTVTITDVGISSSIALANGEIPSNGSCEVSFDVIPTRDPKAAQHQNAKIQTLPLNAISTNEGATNSEAIIAQVHAATGIYLYKYFDGSTNSQINLLNGNTAKLRLLFHNYNAIDILGFDFSDVMPTSGTSGVMSIDSIDSNTCGGDTSTSTATSLNLTGATLAGVTVNQPGIQIVNCEVIATVSVNEVGTYTNTISAGDLEGYIHPSAAATLTAVSDDIEISKAFDNQYFYQGDTRRLTYTFKNNSDSVTGVDITDLNFDDVFETTAEFRVATPSNVATTCPNATVNAVENSQTVSVSTLTIPKGSTCTISLTVEAATDAYPISTVQVDPIPVGDIEYRIDGAGATQTYALALQSTAYILAGMNITKSFTPTVVGPLGVTRLRIALRHTSYSSFGVDQVAFTDVLPTDHVVASPANVVSDCGGTVIATPGTDTISLTGGLLTAGAVSRYCYVNVNVRVPALTGGASTQVATNTIPGVAHGVTPLNYTGQKVGAIAGQGLMENYYPASATITREAIAATVNKEFLPVSINGGGISRVRVTIANTAPTAINLTEVGLTDSFGGTDLRLYTNVVPSFTDTNGSSTGACRGGAFTGVSGDTSITLANAIVDKGATCRFEFNITASVGGNHINTIGVGDLQSLEGVTNERMASATLTVGRQVNVAKNFSPAQVGIGGTSVLTLEFFNTSNSTDEQGASPALIDVMPAGITVDSIVSNSCGGSATIGSSGGIVDNTVQLSGGTFVHASSCLIKANVSGNAPGTYVNTIAIGDLKTVSGAENPDSAEATLVIIESPTIEKSFSPSSIGVDGESTVVLVLRNPHSSAVTGVSFEDDLTNMVIAADPAVGGTCANKAYTAVAGANKFELSDATIPANGGCTVSFKVTSSVEGAHPNQTTGVSTNLSPTPGEPSNEVSLNVLVPLTMTKVFDQDTISINQTSKLTFTLTNPNAVGINLDYPAFTDVFPTTPGNMVIADPANFETTCGIQLANPTFTNYAASGDTGVAPFAGRVPANDSCTMSLDIAVDAVGDYVNTTSTLVTPGGTTPAASDTLHVYIPDYSDAPVSYGEAMHEVITGVQLGATVTKETSSVIDADNASDDGVSAFPLLSAGDTGYTIPKANLSAAGTGTLYAWIDFDGSGLFEGDEFASTTVISDVVQSDLVFTNFGTTMSAGTTYARFRFTSDALVDDGGTTGVDERVTAAASDGEVEDYAVDVKPDYTYATPPSSCSYDGEIYYNTPSELRSYNTVSGTDTLILSGLPTYGDIALANNGKMYGINFDYGYTISEINLSTGAATTVLSGSEISGGNSLTADEHGWLYFGSGNQTGGASSSKVYRFLPGQMTVPELWIDFADYGFSAGLSGGDFIFKDNVAYVGWALDRTSTSNFSLLKVDNLGTYNGKTASTTITSIGSFGAAAVWGIAGADNDTMYALSGNANELLKVTLNPFTVTTATSLVGQPYGATSGSEAAGISCSSTIDYSDAPSSYGVATHTVISGVQLGASITDESSAVQDADNASDDGIDLSGLVRGSPKLITVHVPFSNGTDYLQGWVDWNGDGDFLDVGEQVATDLRDDGNGVDGTFNDGQIQVMLNVPAGAAASTWARFRYSSDAGLASTGTASDGEVEDYLITISDPVASVPIDPQACTGGNLLTNGDFNSGSTSWLESHRSDTSASGPMTIGLVGVNSSLTGAPWIGPNGDGVARSYVDNDGDLGDTYVNLRNETVLSLTNGQTYNFGFDIQEIPNGANQSALIGWVLVDATTGAIVQQVPGVSVELDGTDKTGSYPLVTTSWQTFSQRFTATVPTGNYKLAMTFDAYLDSSIAMIDFYMDKVYFAPETVCDYSDGPADGGVAPASGTTAYGKTRHAQVAGFHLGVNVTDETSAVTDADNASDNGIASFTLTAGATENVTIPAGDITGTGTGTLHAWIDFNGGGAFTVGEYASVGFNSGATGPLIFSNYGITMSAGSTYARFRLTSATLTDNASTSNVDERAITAVLDGEVEDYKVTVESGIPPLSCDATLYQVASSPSILRSTLFSGSNATFNDLGTASQNLNGAWGYNTLDNYIYGIRAGTKDVYRVGADGVFNLIGTASTLPANANNAGDVTDAGELITKLNSGNNDWAVVDLTDPIFPVLRTFTLSGAAAGKVLFDVAWNPIDGMIYGVATDTTILKIDTTTGVGVAVVAATGATAELGNIASTWISADGRFIGYNNSRNAYYSIDLTTGDTSLLSSSVSSGGASDGAGCRAVAPLPTGVVSGTVYHDDDGSNTFDSGIESEFDAISVSLYFDNGTPTDSSDDTLVGTRSTTADGSYRFTGVNASSGITYRVEVNDTDTDLPDGMIIGTTNPLAGLVVTNGGTTTANFGFDQPRDFSDGASSYGVATHLIITGIQLGANVTAESAAAEGADNASDDGISAFSTLSDQDRTYSVNVITTNQTANPAQLIAWIDFDGNGSFDADEAAMRTIASGTVGGNATLTWSSIPLDIQAGNTYVRLRLSTESINNREPDGAKMDGEVEDYPITITTPAGVTLSGRVFRDVNANAVNDSSEAGVTQLPVVLYNTANKKCVSTRTNGNGDYRFEGVTPGNYQVYEASRERVPTPRNCGPSFAKDPGGYRSTTQNALDAFDVASSDIPSLDFGDVKPPVFEPNNTGQVLPGNVLFYAHRFRTPTSGSVRFTSTSSGNVSSGWSSLIYQDGNCNGKLDGTEGSVAMTGTYSRSTTWVSDAVSLVAGDQTRDRVCLINKIYAPANVAANDGFLQTITADFDYNGNTVAGNQVLTAKDLTTAKQVQAPALPATPEVIAAPAIAAQPEQAATSNVPATETTAAVPSTPYIPAIDEVPAQVAVAATPVVPEVGPSRLELRKTVQNTTQVGSPETETVNQAAPGDTLKYRIYYSNTGSGPLTELKVNDIVPPYTSLELLSNVCHDTPAGMTCAPVISGDDLRWDFTGSLLGGASGWVSYSVVVDD